MNDGDEHEMYQTEMERILSHNVYWLHSQCRKMELDHARCIKNRENQLEKSDKALDVIVLILAGKRVKIDTGSKYLDKICVELRVKLKEKPDES